MSFVSQHSGDYREDRICANRRRMARDFGGPFVISAAHADLESCRSALLAAVDERIIAWLSETPVSPPVSAQEARATALSAAWSDWTGFRLGEFATRLAAVLMKQCVLMTDLDGVARSRDGA